MSLNGHGKDKLVLLADAGDERRAPGAEELLAGDARVAAGFWGLPDLLAGLLVDREEELPFAGAAPLDAQVAVKDRRGGGAPEVFELADVVLPEFLAVEVVADQAGRAVAGDHALAVGHRRGGTERDWSGA